MKIYITVKGLGKKKDYITRKEFVINTEVNTLRELITYIVSLRVEEYNIAKTDTPFVSYLTESEIELKSTTGKVGFGTKYNDNKADLKDAITTALLAYEDGLYKVFWGDDEVEGLDLPLDLADGDVVTFVRLTMLAGRIW